MPKISIIIPTYNAAEYLCKTLDSILVQSFTDYEVVIVDDGSIDNTREVVLSYNDRRIRYFSQKGSGGPASPRNMGIHTAKSDYVAIFDADDIMLPGKLEKQFAFLQKNPDVALIFSNYEEIDEEDNVIASNCLYRSKEFQKNIAGMVKSECYKFSSSEIVDSLLRHNFIPTSSVIAKKETIQSVGGFDESIQNSDDHDLWLKILDRNDCACIDHILHQYRVRKGNISSRGIHRLVEGRCMVLKRHLSKAKKKSTKKIVRDKIAGYQYTAGYYHFSRNELSNAKSCFIQSLKYNPKIRVFVYWIACCLGNKFVENVRKMKRNFAIE